ncbi:hypothetical protein JCM19231_2050 [Vibrio ishigakensis]|uniref:Uncharacterized protein n=1 Tax=Vibrio ishigakensis TaxID=1481914 RepID=A0A0B8NXB7_9VIBR|nr:hypothetical protein [Vibrio ishigakensis]GAM56902.1 hypothetical protein JCM19231_2050 [Vibrio ishigakensis]
MEQVGYGYAALQKDLPNPLRLESLFIGQLKKIDGAATGINIAYKLTGNDNEVVADFFVGLA